MHHLFKILATRFQLGYGFHDALNSGYTRDDLRADVLAGLTVGIVAVPLAMALAIASGVPPQYGLYTSIVAGLLIALFGGSRLSVSGPTAAFVVILHPIATKYGVGGLLVSTMMAGFILLFMGIARVGRLIEFIPYPVTTGFTAGIAVVIASLQLKDFFGLELPASGAHFLDKLAVIVTHLHTFNAADLGIGLLTLLVLIGWARRKSVIPPHLVAITVGTLCALLLARFFEGFDVATIASRFSWTLGGETGRGIPPAAPLPVLPWNFPGPDGAPMVLNFGVIRELFPSAIAIALLGAIESLLCAVVADGLAGTKHDPNSELIGQGIGNIVVPFFGGIAATGAIARSATNIRAGARSPLASMIHAAVVLVAVVSMASVLNQVPMAALAALLLITAWNMSEARHFAHILRVAPRSDIIVLLTCFTLTVIFDMTIAVTAGVLLAAMLFMRRMAEISQTRLIDESHPVVKAPLPKNVRLYEIAGPLFFGAAERAMSTLLRTDKNVDVVVLHLGGVPTMDMTGLSALETAIKHLYKRKVFVVLAAVQSQPAELMRRAGLEEIPAKLVMTSTLDEALAHARLKEKAEPE